VTQKCAIDVVLRYPNTKFFTPGVYFTNAATILYDPPIRVSGQALLELTHQSVLDSLVLGDGGAAETPRVPLLVYHSKNDEIVSERRHCILTGDPIRPSRSNGSQLLRKRRQRAICHQR
jgi:hypothetical protein